jgi:hypothetical protein
MRSLVKALVPTSVRSEIRAKQQDWALRKAIRPLREKGSLTEAELEAFHTAWGNKGFSADKRFLAEVIRLINEHKGPVLECGTGATTVIAAVLAERFGFNVYCLEQDPAWATAARRALRFNKLERVFIFDTPLKSFDSYLWYDTARVALPDHFGLVVCDGPYIDKAHGEQMFSQWRYGVMPLFASTGRRFKALLLDDMDDPHQRAEPVTRSWEQRFGTSVQVTSAQEGAFALITQSAGARTEAVGA